MLSVTGRIDYLAGQWSNNSALKAQCIQELWRAVNDPTTSLADQAAAVGRGFVGAYAASSSFARLRELGVAWRTHGAAARAGGAKHLTLAITGRNLALISGFKGWDPEVQTLPTDLAPRQGVPVPLPRTVTFRLGVDW